MSHMNVRKIVKDLSNNKKYYHFTARYGRVVIVDRQKYLDKCLDILNIDLFIKLSNNPTSCIEKKVQHNLKKIKQKLPKDIYTKLYST